METFTKNSVEQISDIEKEQIEIANKFGILNHKDLVKKEDGEWYIYGMKAKDYMDEMNTNDNRAMYK